jgi:uncharacterized protein (TIGR03083 family)
VDAAGLDVPEAVARLRRDFADRIDSLDEVAWNSASWCEGWQVRDVLSHLVRNAEMTYGSLALDLVRGGFRPDASMSKAAKRLGRVSVPELADRLRTAADRHLRLPGSSEGMGLADVLVHSQDAFRPVGLATESPPAGVATALDALWQNGRVVVHAVPHRGRQLVATDLEWSKGSGPEVRGKGLDLLMLVANRRQVLPCLEGPGLAGL